MKKFISIVLVAAMLVSMVPSAFAESTAAGEGDETAVELSEDSRFAGVIEGKKADNGEPLYVYSDRFFTESSFKVNRQLAALSSFVADDSRHYNKIENAGGSGNGIDVTGMLTDCGFSDVQTNKYFFLPTEENSQGVVAGHKTLHVGNKEYTLLAVFPMSPAYGQEWGGNFTVGKGSIHQGFKAARDEVLRFLKNYISEHEIKGDLKVWITGHSRFGAVSNLVGGFFAGGGAGYFDDVATAPEDVYCYTFAPPTTIFPETATKEDALSVEGSRGQKDERYKGDSAGEAYEYKGSDAKELVMPNSEAFKGIKNCKPSHDLITLLPPEIWGLDRYGVDLPLKDDKDETRARMLEVLKLLYPSTYKSVADGADEEGFRWKKFDFDELALVNDMDAEEQISQGSMFRSRVNYGLARRAGTLDEYVDGGYQDTMRPLAALVGMEMDDLLDSVKDKQQDAIKAVLFAYLSYAAERLGEEKNYNENTAIAAALEQIVEIVTGEKIDPENFTVDNLFQLLAQYMIDHTEYTEAPATDEIEHHFENIKFNSKLAELIFEQIAHFITTSVPEDKRTMLTYFIRGYDPNNPGSDESKEAVTSFLVFYMKMCAYGDGTKEEPGYSDGFRAVIYQLADMTMTDGEYKDIVNAMGTNGSARFEDFISGVMAFLMKTPEGSGTYESVSEAADAYLKEVIGYCVDQMLRSGKYPEGSVQYSEIEVNGSALLRHTTQLREMLMDTLFYDVDEYNKPLPFDTERNIRYAATLAGHASNILNAHLIDTYDSWMRAQNTPDSMRKSVITLLNTLLEENEDKVLDKDKFEIAILRAESAARDAETVDELERILAKAKETAEDGIQAKKDADKAAAEKEEKDNAAVNHVKEQIDALPKAANVKLSDKDAIMAARNSYDDLSPDQKAKFPPDTLQHLTGAEQVLNAAEEAAKAEEQAKKTEEIARKAAEEASKAAADRAEETLKAAEKIAEEAVKAREAAEEALEVEKQARKAAEQAADAMKFISDAAGQARDAVQLALDAAEQARKALEEALGKSEKARQEAEQAREAAEKARDEAEKKREDAEKEREAEKEKPIELNTVILTGTTFKYNGKVQKPSVMLVVGGNLVAGPDDYDVEYSGGDSKEAGLYTVTVTGKGRFTGSAWADYTIEKASNPVKVKGKTVKVKYSAVSKRNKTIRKSNYISVKNAKTKITYELKSVSAKKYSKYFSFNTKKKKITVKSGIPQGKYTLKIKISAAENMNYKAKTKTAAVKIFVK